MSIVDVCNAMGISEPGYSRMVVYLYHQSVYQLIMFILLTEYHLDSV